MARYIATPRCLLMMLTLMPLDTLPLDAIDAAMPCYDATTYCYAAAFDTIVAAVTPRRFFRATLSPC